MSKIIYMECTINYMQTGFGTNILPIIEKGNIKKIEDINYLVISC